MMQRTTCYIVSKSAGISRVYSLGESGHERIRSYGRRLLPPRRIDVGRIYVELRSAHTSTSSRVTVVSLDESDSRSQIYPARNIKTQHNKHNKTKYDRTRRTMTTHLSQQCVCERERVCVCVVGWSLTES